MSSREVYEAVMDKTELYENKNDYLRNIIRGYTAFINNKIEKHFSQVFNEPMSSAKIHSIIKEKKDNGKYLDKILEIMEVESGTNFYAKTRGHPLVRYKYTEFTEGISPKTSSSSLKSADRISPKRKTTKVHIKSENAVTKKASPTPKNKLSEIMKSHRESVKLRIQQEKEKKAIERQRVKEEKEAEKQRIKDEKALAKSEKSKAKTAPKAKTAKSKTVILEEIPDEEEV
jgi:LPS O-antigen subunit length determinant protein (WzzB/FepE family)